jgi:DNA-binding transcriptional ArsR family regulator
MLIAQQTLRQIVDGEVTLAFRRWKRPSVKAGGRLRTSVGELRIVSVQRVAEHEIGEEDARRAGAASREELVKRWARKQEGDIYRIELAYAGPDPRVALRADAKLSAADVAAIAARLDALDRRGPWTRATLSLIEQQPETLAAELAEQVGRPRLAFKADVRKLKELGLTESRRPGYRLSPRGRAFLAAERRALGRGELA